MIFTFRGLDPFVGNFIVVLFSPFSEKALVRMENICSSTSSVYSVHAREDEKASTISVLPVCRRSDAGGIYMIMLSIWHWFQPARIVAFKVLIFFYITSKKGFFPNIWFHFGPKSICFFVSLVGYKTRIWPERSKSAEWTRVMTVMTVKRSTATRLRLHGGIKL